MLTNLFTHVDNSAGSVDTEHREENERDGEEYDDQGGCSLAEASSDSLDLRLHGGGLSGSRSGGWGHNTTAVVCLHHHPHLTLTFDNLVLRSAVAGDALCKLGTLKARYTVFSLYSCILPCR